MNLVIIIFDTQLGGTFVALSKENNYEIRKLKDFLSEVESCGVWDAETVKHHLKSAIWNIRPSELPPKFEVKLDKSVLLWEVEMTTPGMYKWKVTDDLARRFGYPTPRHRNFKETLDLLKDAVITKVYTNNEIKESKMKDTVIANGVNEYGQPFNFTNGMFKVGMKVRTQSQGDWFVLPSVQKPGDVCFVNKPSGWMNAEVVSSSSLPEYDVVEVYKNTFNAFMLSDIRASNDTLIWKRSEIPSELAKLEAQKKEIEDKINSLLKK